MTTSEEQGQPYRVVRNGEDQYSIWLDGLDVPDGWIAVGTPASRQACLERIEQLWLDMLPRSLKLRGRS